MAAVPQVPTLGGPLGIAAKGGLLGVLGAGKEAIGTSIFTGLAGLINPVIGGLAALFTLLNTKTLKPPVDVLTPLRIIQSEFAAGRPDSDASVAAEQLFEQRRLGLIADVGLRIEEHQRIGEQRRATRAEMEAEIARLRGFLVGRGNKNLILNKIKALEQELALGVPGDIENIPLRQIQAVRDQLQSFGSLSAREILRSVDILPGEGTFGLLPLGSIVDPQTKLGLVDREIDVGPTVPREDFQDAAERRVEFLLGRGRANVSGIGLTRLGGGAALADAENFLAPVLNPPELPHRPEGGGAVVTPAAVVPTSGGRRPGREGFAAAIRERRFTSIIGSTPERPPGGFGFTATRRDEPVSINGFFEGVGDLLGSAITVAGANAPLIAQTILASQGRLGQNFAPAVQRQQVPSLTGGGITQGGGFVNAVDLLSFDARDTAADLMNGASRIMRGGGDAVAALTSPFRVTSSGNEVAQPYAAAKANGNVEWFIPAGRPTSFTKARRITRRHHHHPPQHPRRRRRPR